MDLTREAVRLCLLLAGPLLATAVVAAILCGILQTAFQVHEHTLSFVPKLVATVIAFLVIMPWFSGRLVEFTQELISAIPHRL
jgi:flagellar biosynthetic protein FliQ